jgi:type II secretory pathway predicted ATPase ExeA
LVLVILLTGLRKLRLSLEDFPKNHNLILIGQPSLLSNLHLGVNDDIKSRVTFSVVVPRLNPDHIRGFILAQLDAVSLAHNAFSEEALALRRLLRRRPPASHPQSLPGLFARSRA